MSTVRAATVANSGRDGWDVSLDVHTGKRF
jgi:hypothetical protein